MKAPLEEGFSHNNAFAIKLIFNDYAFSCIESYFHLYLFRLFLIFWMNSLFVCNAFACHEQKLLINIWCNFVVLFNYILELVCCNSFNDVDKMLKWKEFFFLIMIKTQRNWVVNDDFHKFLNININYEKRVIFVRCARVTQKIAKYKWSSFTFSDNITY